MLFVVYFFYRSDIDETLSSYGRCGVRVYGLVQALIATVKVDGVIDWNWKTTLFLSWVMVFLLMFYTIGLFLIAVCTCYYRWKGEAQWDQVLGAIFLLVVSMFATFFVFFFTVGVIEYMENGSPNYLLISLGLVIVYSIVIDSIGYCRREQLKVFLWKLLTEDEDEGSSSNRASDQTTRAATRKKPKRRIERMIPGNRFLVRFSSTYFKMATADKPTRERKDKAKPMSITVKRNDESPSDEYRRQVGSTDTKRRAASSHVIPPIGSSRSPREVTKGLSSPQRRQNNLSMQVTHNMVLDLEQVNKILSNYNSPRLGQVPQGPESKGDRSSASCLICFDQPPNAVFMDCGHGGICYDCGLEIWKKGEDCYLCRGTIKQLLKVDVKALEGNQVKIMAVTYLEDESVEEPAEVPQ
eukprot:TRINITY_DN9682_c0_g1_i1.p1 TRINITY_DN9682_c0_g1~~TRINITY_DN9682_c0_g1_i1.p1  ORF type:complete len:411 (+),score=78.97 TRINITY_DN9682_c0_g1_i1:149-1381(+)